MAEAQLMEKNDVGANFRSKGGCITHEICLSDIFLSLILSTDVYNNHHDISPTWKGLVQTRGSFEGETGGFRFGTSRVMTNAGEAIRLL